MSYYVRIKRLNGRQDHADLADFLNTCGISNVDYCIGGWEDQMVHNVAAHLKFETEEDALIYIIAKGGDYSTTVPQADLNTEIDWWG